MRSRAIWAASYFQQEAIKEAKVRVDNLVQVAEDTKAGMHVDLIPKVTVTAESQALTIANLQKQV